MKLKKFTKKAVILFLAWCILSMQFMLGGNLAPINPFNSIVNAAEGTQVKVVAGSNHVLLLKADGSVWAWGNNGNGQLGDGTTMYSSEPKEVAGLTGIIDIATGSSHSMALKSDGTVWTWGHNGSGQLGDGTTTNRLQPIQISGLTGITAISGGENHSMALKNDGTVWCWGSNTYGELGRGNTTVSYTPIQVQSLTDVKSIAAGRYYFSSALKNDGTVWTWGYNGHGVLGDGTTTNRTTPVKVSSISSITAITTGYYHMLALKSDGTVWSWGYNAHGELGDSSTSNRSTPYQISSLTGVTYIQSAYYHNFALKSDGSLWAWGNNGNGELGDGTTSQRNSPVQITAIDNIKKITGGNGFTIALKKDYSLWGWGSNNLGQLADGSVIVKYSPEQMPGLDSVVDIACGDNHSMALKSDGTVWAWGYNGYGQLGDGTTVNKYQPVQVQGLTGVTAISSDGIHNLALKSNGTVWAWGNNGNGQLGDGTTTNRTTPVQVSGISGVTMITNSYYHSMAKQSNGSLYAWGYNPFYQLGNGNTSNYYTPQYMSYMNSSTAITGIAVTYYSSFHLYSSNIYGLGYNGHGELGTGNTSTYSSQVSSISNISKLSTGYFHVLALHTNGNVYSWGYNAQGQIGNGNTSNQLTPYQVSGLSSVTSIGAGNYHSFAVKSDKTLWAWGRNNYGQLGDGTNTQRNTPIQITGISNVSKVTGGENHTLALTTDGKVWSWGYNNYGQTGLHKIDKSLTPLRIDIETIYFESTNIDNIQQKSIQASWTVTGITQGAMYSLAAFNKDGNLVQQNPWTTEYTDTITGLQARTDYTIKIKARDPYGMESEWYEIGEATTLHWNLELELSNYTSSTIDIKITDENIESIEYQIMSGGQYLSEKGELVDIPLWLTISGDTIKATALSPDTTYSFTIKSREANGTESPWSSRVYGRTLVGSPTALMGITTISEHNAITLIWEPIEGAEEYEIEIDGVVAERVRFTSLSYKNTGLLPNTQHTYRIRPLNAGGSGEWSNYVSAVTLRLPPTVPENIKTSKTNTTITLAWDVVPTALTYEIEADGVIRTTGRLAGFKHIYLKPNTQHAYRIRARNESGAGPWSQVYVEKTTFNPPTVPKNIKAIVSKSVITLSWDAEIDAESYEIEENGKTISNGKNTFCRIDGLAPKTQRTYRIRATNKAGSSNWSSELNLVTFLLDTPENLTATEAETKIALAWDEVENASQYEIEVDEEVVPNADSTTYEHTQLLPETIHGYRVRALNTEGISSWTELLKIATLPVKPATPESIYVKANQDMITITWEPIPDAIGYDVEIDGITIDNGENTFYVHDDLDMNTIHTYRVRAKTAAIEGDFSEKVSVVTLSQKPGAPKNFRLTTANSTIVELAWDKVEGALSYDIEIDGVVINTGNRTTYTHRRIDPNTQHKYKVRTVSKMGLSSFSDQIINNTLLAFCSKNQELQLGLTGDSITDFSRYTLHLTYNKDVLKVLDLCALTSKAEQTATTIEGTDITITKYTPGEITFVVDRVLSLGETWSGVLNNIILEATVTGGTPITYTVYEQPEKTPEEEEE